MTSTLAERAGASAAVASPWAAERVELALEGMTCARARLESRTRSIACPAWKPRSITPPHRRESITIGQSGVDARWPPGPRGVWRPRQAGRSGGACTRIVTAHAAWHAAARAWARRLPDSAVRRADDRHGIAGRELSHEDLLPRGSSSRSRRRCSSSSADALHRCMECARGGGANMDVLIALGTSIAWLWSAIVTVFGLHDHVYFEASAAIITLVLLGKALEARARAVLPRARSRACCACSRRSRARAA